MTSDTKLETALDGNAAQLAIIDSLKANALEKFNLKRSDGATLPFYATRNEKGEVAAFSFEHWLDLPPSHHKKTQMFFDLESLIHYVNDYKDDGESRVFVECKDKVGGDGVMAIVRCCIDYGTPETPGHNDHSALYSLRFSAAMRRALTLESGMSQEEFADFVEDDPSIFVDPAAAKMMELAIKFRARVDEKFEKVVNRENGDIELRHSVETSHPETLKVPKSVTLRLPIIENTDPVEVNARFVYHVRGGNLALGLRFTGIEQVRSDVLADVVQRLRDGTELPTHLTVA